MTETNPNVAAALVGPPGAGRVLSLTLLGAGKLGCALARLWHVSGALTIQDVLTRSSASSSRAVQLIGSGRPVHDYGELGRADLYLVATPDQVIAASTERLALCDLIDPESIVFHCSGAQSSELLAEARKRGAAVASAHPVTSFPATGETGFSLAGVGCALEGDPRATRTLEALFHVIGAHCFNLSADRKLIYHAAAVFGSNYLVTLIEVAMETYALAGVGRDEAQALLGRLAEQTLKNVLQQGTQAALTGPIARGDGALVRRQYAALQALDHPLAELYRVFARATSRLARREDPLAGEGIGAPDGAPD